MVTVSVTTMAVEAFATAITQSLCSIFSFVDYFITIDACLSIF
ncbi:hypothetical protein [Domibacillus sp.]|nr:hypothetical protein [Domibacillus sp.]